MAAQMPDPPLTITYPGMCEASAAVALGAGSFAVADDDEKDLRVYRLESPAKPQILQISKAVPDLAEKADLEGAARIGDDIYWLGSHSRKKSGEERPGGRRLFAIHVAAADGGFRVEPVGRPYKTLLEDLQKDGRYNKYELDKAAALTPEEPGGLNIEGLAAQDRRLLIGFRNPVRAGKALIATLENPRQVLDGQPAIFGAPVELDLENLGIRSLEHWPAAKAYVIIAGTPEDAGRFQAFRWSGIPCDKPQPIADVDLSGLVPEAVFFESDTTSELIVLSDDGATCSEDKESKAFRSRRLPLGGVPNG
jgi:hypothetical protein